MSDESPRTMTQLLRAWREGDRQALDRLMAVAEGELRELARNRLRGERREHTLDSAALVNEAYIRLVRQKQLDLADRAHFLGISANLMRQILIDHARKRNAGKRPEGAVRVSISKIAADLRQEEQDPEILSLIDALNRLRELDARQSEIVTMRFIVGMTVDEIAEHLEIGTATVKRSWATAKAWLYHELKHE